MRNINAARLLLPTCVALVLMGMLSRLDPARSSSSSGTTIDPPRREQASVVASSQYDVDEGNAHDAGFEDDITSSSSSSTSGAVVGTSRSSNFGGNYDNDDYNVDAICELSKTNFTAASGLHSIVTGCPHSGTTIVSQLIMSAPGLFGAVEGGLLYTQYIKRFEFQNPYYKHLIQDRMWGLSKDQRSSLMNSTCHAEMYRRLHRYSPVYSKNPNEDSMIVDKAPWYMYKLPKVMDRSPGVPVIITTKSKEDQYESFLKRKKSRSSSKRRITIASMNLKAALQKYPERIHVVNTTELLENPYEVMKAVYDFLDLTWDDEYLTMESVNAKSRAVGLREMVPFDVNRTKVNNNKHGTKRFKHPETPPST